ncbi:MAG: type II toxin-antitoxin system RelE/ParE family toxin [bacterium]
MQVETIAGEIDKFILKLDPQTQAKVLRYLELLECYGNKLGMPYSKSLHGGLFELRIIGSKQVRIIYCFHKNKAYLVNAFIKKTNKIPKKEIDLALKRLKILA